MLLQHFLSDRGCLNRTKQYPRRPQIVGFQAQADDLAHGRIAQQVIGDFHRELHGTLGGALVALGLVFFLRRIELPGKAGDFLGAVGG